MASLCNKKWETRWWLASQLLNLVLLNTASIQNFSFLESQEVWKIERLSHGSKHVFCISAGPTHSPSMENSNNFSYFWNNPLTIGMHVATYDRTAILFYFHGLYIIFPPSIVLLLILLLHIDISDIFGESSHKHTTLVIHYVWWFKVNKDFQIFIVLFLRISIVYLTSFKRISNIEGKLRKNALNKLWQKLCPAQVQWKLS